METPFAHHTAHSTPRRQDRFAARDPRQPAPGDEPRLEDVRRRAQYDLSKRTLRYTSVGSAKQVTKTRTTAFDVGVKHIF